MTKNVHVHLYNKQNMHNIHFLCHINYINYYIKSLLLFHYKRSQGFVKSVHEVLLPKYPDLKLIFYDLGLTRQQYNIVRINSNTYSYC